MKKYALILLLIAHLFSSKVAAQDVMVALEPDTRNENGYYTTLRIAKKNAIEVETLDIKKEDGDDFLSNPHSFPALHTLLIHFSNLSSFNSINVNQRLKEIRIMYSWKLKQLPEDITELPDLKSIAVYSCGLGSLPPKFFLNPSLEEVCVCYNNLDALPEIPTGSRLRSLVLDINNFSTLPKDFSNLTQLEILGLKDCQFSTFPNEVLALTNLKVLDVSANNISSLPANLGNLKTLEKLYLVKTGIRKLPKSLRHTSLKYVAISDTDLSQTEKKNIIKSLPKGCQVNWTTELNYVLDVSSCVCLKPSYIN